jgi:hypothetical protein
VLCPLLAPWSHALLLLLLLLVEASAAGCPLAAQAAGPKAAAHRLPAAARPASAPPCPLRAAAFTRLRSILAAAAAEQLFGHLIDDMRLVDGFDARVTSAVQPGSEYRSPAARKRRLGSRAARVSSPAQGSASLAYRFVFRNGAPAPSRRICTDYKSDRTGSGASGEGPMAAHVAAPFRCQALASPCCRPPVARACRSSKPLIQLARPEGRRARRQRQAAASAAADGGSAAASGGAAAADAAEERVRAAALLVANTFLRDEITIGVGTGLGVRLPLLALALSGPNDASAVGCCLPARPPSPLSPSPAARCYQLLHVMTPFLASPIPLCARSTSS